MKSFIPMSFRLTSHALRLTLSLLSLVPLLLGSPAVVQAQWEPDRRLTVNDGRNSWDAGVATSGDTIHVVWVDDRDGNSEIYYKRSIDGGVTWESDYRCTNDSNESWWPRVATANSNVHLVWMDRRDGNLEIYYKRSTDWGTSWGPDTRLTYDPAQQSYPGLAALDSQVHVTYDNWASTPEIYYKRSTDGGATWLPDTRLSYDPAGSYYSSISASGSNVHVAWRDDRHNISEVFYKRSTNRGATWGPDTNLTISDSSVSDYPIIASLDPNVHVVWFARDSNFVYEVYYKRSTDGGASWQPDTQLTNDPAWSAFPVIAVSGSMIHVVWEDGRDNNDEIYYKDSKDGGITWEPDTRLTFNSSISREPSIALYGSKIHVVWQDTRDGQDEIYYKRNPTGNLSVEEGQALRLTPHASRLTVSPNPFNSFAALPGHEKESFSLYDVSGRKVGTYRGERIGEGLGAGVYFLKSVGKDVKPLRIVKLR